MKRGRPLARRKGLTAAPWQRKADRPARARAIGAENRTPKKASRRRETVPPAVRATVEARDALTCQRCCKSRWLDVHHRRPKGMGGSVAPHTDCPCNAILLCRGCHDDVHHVDPRSAIAEGFLLSKLSRHLDGTQMQPGEIAVMRFAAGPGGASMYPTCDGQWSSAPQSYEAPATGQAGAA